MSVLFSPFGNSQFFDDNGDPATGWKIFTYAAGSSTPLATFTTSSGSVAQSNPIIIDSLGFPSVGQVWLTSGLAYKLVLTNASNVVKKTEDNITGVTGVSSVTQWIASGLTPTYVSATSFTLVGDQTSEFHVQRRLQSTNTSGTIYSTITATAYTTLTTVTVLNDSGALDSGLSAVNLGFLTAVNPSVPASYAKSGANTDITSRGNNTSTAYITGGILTAYTLTPTPAITAYAAGQSFGVTFNVASGAAPTITISGIATPPNLVKQLADGTYGNVAAGDIPINHRGQVTLLSPTQALVNLPIIISSKIQPISASVLSNALTLTLNPTTLDFRSATLGSGTVNTRTLASAITLVVPSTATLGTTSAVSSKLILLAIDNAGTIELSVINMAGGAILDETTLISTTAISASATSASLAYSTTARASVPFRVVGYVEFTQATAGTWATSPSTIQGAGGQSVIPVVVNGAFRYLRVFTASGTYTKPTGLMRAKITVIGGGGAGNFSGSGGPGGGGGGTSIAVKEATSISATESITVGVGGGSAGNNGGTSSVGSFASATGGSGAASASNTGGQGGTGSGGDINIGGGGGGGADGGRAGAGGSSSSGGGAAAGGNAGSAGRLYGGGGGGGYASAGVGAAGIVFIEEFF